MDGYEDIRGLIEVPGFLLVPSIGLKAFPRGKLVETFGSGEVTNGFLDELHLDMMAFIRIGYPGETLGEARSLLLAVVVPVVEVFNRMWSDEAMLALDDAYFGCWFSKWISHWIHPDRSSGESGSSRSHQRKRVDRRSSCSRDGLDG